MGSSKSKPVIESARTVINRRSKTADLPSSFTESYFTKNPTNVVETKLHTPNIYGTHSTNESIDLDPSIVNTISKWTPVIKSHNIKVMIQLKIINLFHCLIKEDTRAIRTICFNNKN
jgi:hypothetical protein